MHTDTTIHIEAPLEPIFRLAAEIEHWPERLPHYRRVTVLETDGQRRRVEMAARRGLIPVKWQAVQEVMDDGPYITYLHVRGPTTGMEVVWSFEPEGEGHLVRIVHDLTMRWPLIGGPVADLIVGPHFVDPIAGLTLRTVKRLAESGWRP
jgi:ribosome-associated toxin RatA of RatAB toxin-antitoxin module